jgi:type VI secretion system protein ImpG
MTDQLLPYYNQELEFLRRFGSQFAAEHPKIAGRLRLGDDLSEDPHVSRVIEAFALLAARTRLKIDDDFPEITHAMLGVLYPHYLAPIPSTAIVEFSLDRRQADLVAGYEIAAGESVESESTTDGVCQFRTAYPVKLFPLRIHAATYRGQPFSCPPTSATAASESVLQISLKSLRSSVPIGTMDLRTIRFFIRGLSHAAMDLYELVQNDVVEVLIAKSADDPSPIRLGSKAIKPVGFAEDESLLPAQPRTFSGYRLLSEYFSSPEKFMFFDVTGIDPAKLASFEEDLSVFVLLKRHVGAIEPFVAADTIRIGCTPIVNLFEHRTEPIRVTQGSTEYRVVPDARQPRAFEVHTINRVTAIDTEKRETIYYPFYSVRHAAERQSRRGFYHLHRRPAELSGGETDRATDVFLSLVDLDFRPQDPAGTVLDIRALCTSRNLPERLEFGGGHPQMQLVRGGPVMPPKCITQPRATVRPPLGQGSFWRLISHLSLGHISLFDQTQGASALREILSLYEYGKSSDVRQRIDSLQSVSYTHGVARCESNASGGVGATTFCRGLDLKLLIDEEKLSSGGAYLFGAVLENFLALYASINSFTRVTLHSTLREEPIAKWPARSGRKTLL